MWATLKLIDACRGLSEEQLATTVPGTYGSIIETLRHTVAADAGYLWVLSRGAVDQIEDDREATLDLPSLRALMERYGQAWPDVLAERTDPDETVVRNRDDGSTTVSPVGIRLAQVIHHGTDHRSQICTALTTLGIEPPEIDAWSYAIETGLFRETPPST